MPKVTAPSAAEAVKRARGDMSQSELARRAGLHQPHLSQVESGVRPLTLFVATRIEFALDLDRDSLVQYAKDRPPSMNPKKPGYRRRGHRVLSPPVPFVPIDVAA